MKVLLSWLQEYLDLTLSPEEISDALTLAGLEGEGIEEVEGDVVFEIGLTPNLGHCMSIVGIARELSAILNLPLKRKKVTFQEKNEESPFKVEIVDQEGCPRYACRLVKGVKVGESPSWLKKRLNLCGIRSINNLVDIGNYVMLELGQPLHFFDADELKEKKIRVEKGHGGKKMSTLDEEERDIPSDALLILDGSRPIAFAGVMGESVTAVSEKTTNALIEAAQFSPQAVRKSSKLLNLRTESSLRFERGIDPLEVTAALDFAAKMLIDVAGGEIWGKAVDVIATPYAPHLLEMNPKRANKLLGTALSLHEITALLKRLEIKILTESEESIKVEVPSYRNDLKSEIDLIEEVGRMFGFNNIPRKIPRHASSMLNHAPLFLFEEQVRSKLVAQGLQECLTCDLISPKLAKMSQESSMKEEAQIRVLYPASVDQSILRTTLLPGLLEVIKFNLDRQNSSIAAFEVGNIHFRENTTYYGQPVAGIILTGRAAPHHFESKPEEVDFFHLKGHVEDLLASMGVLRQFKPSHFHNFHPGRQAGVFVHDLEVGVVGEVHSRHLREMGIEQRVYYAELNLHDLLQLKKKEKKAAPISNFPGSERDWTVTLNQKVQVGPLLKEMKNLGSSILENVFLLDIYKSEKLGTEKMNVTFRFRYRDLSKTVEYDEVEKEHRRITEHIAQKLENGVV